MKVHVPSIDIPDQFGDVNSLDRQKRENNYLEHLTFNGAKTIYGKGLPKEVTDRLLFELEVIEQREAAAYFLFIHELVRVAQSELGAWVGPGRGSCASSLVNYCLGITKIDPLKHDLLFERFLMPEGRDFPDIDLDMDVEGRNRVIEWITHRYGEECCAHITTFSSSSSKSQRGIHACGFVVSDVPVSELAPMVYVETEDVDGTKKQVRCVQYDGWNINENGLIRFDFIGLLELSMMKDMVNEIKKYKGIDLNMDTIPIDDPKTFELFQNGRTEDVFQFESIGMKRYMRNIHPTCFEDLVILNCMYRPGAIDDLELLTEHKKGYPFRYYIPCMEKYLKNTYGVIAYQEQLMLIPRLVANFNRKESNTLRKAFGKRQKNIIAEMKTKFIEGGMKNGHDKKALEYVWEDMERKGIYAFNKAHGVCYTWIGYQMAYLKTHFPKEFNQVITDYASENKH